MATERPKRKRRRRIPNPVRLELVRARSELIQRSKQEHRAIEMRLRGKGYRDIAAELGLEYNEAATLVQGVLKRDVDVDADRLDELRQLEIGRLDRLWEVYYPRATGNPDKDVQPNMAAANFCMKIAKRRAELLGLDREAKAPQTLNVNVGADAIRQVVQASGDPDALAAMERVAAIFAHGVDAFEGEADEDLGFGPGLATEGADPIEGQRQDGNGEEGDHDGDTGAEGDHEDGRPQRFH